MKSIQKLFGFGTPSLKTRIQWVRRNLELQGEHGNWNYDAYMLGVYNGIECALATLENRQANCRDAPEAWLRDTKVRDCPGGGVVAVCSDPQPSPYKEGARVRRRHNSDRTICLIKRVNVKDKFYLVGTVHWQAVYSLEDMHRLWEVVDPNTP